MFAIGLIVLGAASAPARAVAIARDGAAQAVVVVDADAGPASQHAARELAAFLERVTGGRFDIVNDVAEGRPNLLVGHLAAKRGDAQFTTDGLGTEGIVIRTVGDDLILAGGAPRGTLYAVYTFLEDHVGCRWWSATASAIPRTPTLAVKDLDIRYVPPFEYREVSYFEARNGDYSVRNKLNGQSHRLFKDDGWHNARPDAKRGG
ncbi:MAG: alpha-glucuronidase family glycosyl hydrolase [Phycisphaeraceae bacterium]|jgi:hypothetical protein|nr:alpha-glucuronidase family glycosyl hydrolase [Phycisphaeraceae bacterium]